MSFDSLAITKACHAHIAGAIHGHKTCMVGGTLTCTLDSDNNTNSKMCYDIQAYLHRRVSVSLADSFATTTTHIIANIVEHSKSVWRSSYMLVGCAYSYFTQTCRFKLPPHITGLAELPRLPGLAELPNLPVYTHGERIQELSVSPVQPSVCQP